MIWLEHPDSRDGSVQVAGGQLMCHYRAIGSSNEAAIYAYALSMLPVWSPAKFILSNISLKPVTTGIVEDDFSWEVNATYSHPATDASLEATAIQLPTGGYDWTWKNATQSGHVDHALHQTEYPSGLVDDAGDFKRGINITVDKEVRGVDIPVPKTDLIIWKYFPRALLKGFAGISVLKFLGSCCGKTNKAPWWGFDQGELRFMGCEPEQRGVQDIKLTFHFEYEANVKDIKFGYVLGKGDVTVPLKRGHEYLHTFYVRNANPLNTKVVPVPDTVMVAQVSYELDFTTLALPSYPPPPGY